MSIHDEKERLLRRIEEMENILRTMEEKYEEMLRDNEILKAEIERLKRENRELLKRMGDKGGGEGGD